MYKIKNLIPRKRPKELIRTETNTEEQVFLCPHCLRKYTVSVVNIINYEGIINRAEEGLVLRGRYFCKYCKDYAFQVDPMILPSVKRLISYGIQTISSCSGHPEKFSDTAFEYEDGILGVDGIGEYNSYGACISMLPPRDEENAARFIRDFEYLKEFYSTSNGEAIFLTPDGHSKMYFIVCPVTDVKEFRRAGFEKRRSMILSANNRMDTATTLLVKQLKKVIIA